MAAGITYTPLATTTLGSAASSVTFSSISGSYTDLVLVIMEKIDNSSASFLGMRFNSDTGSNYSVTRVFGNGTSATSDRYSSQTSMDILFPNVNTDTAFSISFVNIMNYSNATTYKTALNRWGSNTYTLAGVGLWRSTSAITSISLGHFASAFNIVAGSTFSLYGITAA